MISTPSQSPAQPQSPMPMMHMQPPPSADLIDLAEVWRVLLNQKWLIFVFTMLGTLTTFVIAKQMTPIYQAEVLLQPITDDGKQGAGGLAQLGGLAAIAGLNIGGGGTSKVALLARLQSRPFIEEFVRNENLLPLLFDKAWDKKSNNWKWPDKIPTLTSGVKTFQGILNIRDEKTHLMYLSIMWKDPELACLWANLVVEKINHYLRTNAILEAKKNMEYLNVELAKTQIVEIKQVIAGLLENQIKKIMLANVNNEFAFKIIDPAVVPEAPIKPKRRTMVMVGFVVSLFLGILTALIRNRLRSRKPANKTLGPIPSK